ncbi:alpha/beta fold hydrolase [Amycolatopsis japonica]
MPDVLPHEIHGSGGHHVMVLHGWFGDRSSFRGIYPFLDRANYTYAFPDYRGYGDSQGIAGEYTSDEIAQDVLHLADSLGWTMFSVVGHSMGGHIAQYLLTVAPERVRKLVGISPVPASGAGFDAGTAEFFACAIDDAEARRTILDRTTGHRLPRTWLDEMVEHSLSFSSREAFASYLPHWSARDFHRQLIGNEVQALAIVGQYDPELSPEVMRATWMRWFPHAELCVLQEAGHYAMDETPLILVATIERFLGE